eukprot:c53785_g1_i1 orf=87-344(+)
MANIDINIAGEYATINVTEVDKDSLVFSRIVKALERNNLDVLQADVSNDDDFSSFSIRVKVLNPSALPSSRLESTITRLIRNELE